MSNKSPINFLGSLVAGIAGRGKGGKLKKLSRKVDQIDRTTKKIESLMPKPGLTDQENFSQQEGITNTVDPTMSAPDIGGVLNPPPTFDPNSREAAAGMFGKPMDDSFDRDMGGEEEIEELV